MNWDFLSSRRFWAMVIAFILGGLEVIGVFPGTVVQPIIKILLGFVAIGTIDKFSKAIAGVK